MIYLPNLQDDPKIHMEIEKIQIAKNILEKMNKVEELNTSQFQNTLKNYTK